MFRCLLPIIPCWIVGCMTNTEYQHISWIFRILTYILHWVAPLIQINELCQLLFCEVALVAFCCSDPVVMIALWVRCVRCDCGPEHGNEKRPNLILNIEYWNITFLLQKNMISAGIGLNPQSYRNLSLSKTLRLAQSTLPHPWNICMAFCQLKVVYSSFSRTCESPSQCWGWYLCVVWMRLLRHVAGAGCTLGSRIKWPHGFLDRLLINQLDIYFSTTL